MILLKPKKKQSLIKLKTKADTLFSKWVRNRDKKCLRCGKTSSLQCAHIITRSNLRLRYDLQNVLTLCAGCHMFWWHRSPLEAITWFQETYPKQYEYLLKAKNEIEKPDYEEVIRFYSKLPE